MTENKLICVSGHRTVISNGSVMITVALTMGRVDDMMRFGSTYVVYAAERSV